MAAIKSRDTKPEIYLRKLLFARGYRYRIAPKNIPGHPDMWLSKYNTALFVHGCFWHKHKGCRYFHMPKSNTEYWVRKLPETLRETAGFGQSWKRPAYGCSSSGNAPSEE